MYKQFMTWCDVCKHMVYNMEKHLLSEEHKRSLIRVEHPEKFGTGTDYPRHRKGVSR